MRVLSSKSYNIHKTANVVFNHFVRSGRCFARPRLPILPLGPCDSCTHSTLDYSVQQYSSLISNVNLLSLFTLLQKHLVNVTSFWIAYTQSSWYAVKTRRFRCSPLKIMNCLGNSRCWLPSWFLSELLEPVCYFSTRKLSLQKSEFNAGKSSHHRWKRQITMNRQFEVNYPINEFCL